MVAYKGFADEFADKVCKAIKKAVGHSPNALFWSECRALGLLVQKGEMTAEKATEAMMARFIRSVKGL